jgi:5-carboxymethyl-2-hydroxymuconate isomerase
MPLVRISLIKGRSAAQRRSIGDAIMQIAQNLATAEKVPA